MMNDFNSFSFLISGISYFVLLRRLYRSFLLRLGRSWVRQCPGFCCKLVNSFASAFSDKSENASTMFVSPHRLAFLMVASKRLMSDWLRDPEMAVRA